MIDCANETGFLGEGGSRTLRRSTVEGDFKKAQTARTNLYRRKAFVAPLSIGYIFPAGLLHYPTNSWEKSRSL